MTPLITTNENHLLKKIEKLKIDTIWNGALEMNCNKSIKAEIKNI